MFFFHAITAGSYPELLGCFQVRCLTYHHGWYWRGVERDNHPIGREGAFDAPMDELPAKQSGDCRTSDGAEHHPHMTRTHAYVEYDCPNDLDVLGSRAS